LAVVNPVGHRVIGLGTDVVEVERFRRVLARTPRVLDRVFTDHERSYAFARRDPMERLAVRFAAKEAVMKALGVGIGQVRFVDIEVGRGSSGVPSVVLHGSATARAASQGVVGWHVSMSHSATVALAVVLALAGEPTS
jgi:holo-[acyl-carrier protein] synthase